VPERRAPGIGAILLAALSSVAPPATAADCGARPCRGFGLAIAYLGEQWWNTAGGLRRDAAWLDNLDLVFAARRGALGIPGLAGRIAVLRNNGAELSPRIVGDLQIVSNIDAPGAWRVYEAWLDWSPAGDTPFSLRAGILATDQEFDVPPTGALFLHSAPGTNTEYALSGLIGPPIFPLSGFGLRLSGGIGDDGYWRAAVLDGVPGDPDDFANFNYRWQRADGALLQAELGTERGAWNRLAVGAWTYSTELDRFLPEADPAPDDWEKGLYVIADRRFADGPSGVLSGYLQAGANDEAFSDRHRLNPSPRFVGAGLVWSALARRPDDALGIMFATAFSGDVVRRERALQGRATDPHETTVELTYRARLTPWLALQPDVQYVINPGFRPELDDALVIGVRVELTLDRRW